MYLPDPPEEDNYDNAVRSGIRTAIEDTKFNPFDDPMPFGWQIAMKPLIQLFLDARPDSFNGRLEAMLEKAPGISEHEMLDQVAELSEQIARDLIENDPPRDEEYVIPF